MIKYASRELPPLCFAALRFTIATTFPLLWASLVEGRALFAIERTDWWRVLLAGLTSVGFHQTLFHLGIN